MRKSVIVTLVAASLGAFTQSASAKPNCATKWAECYRTAEQVRKDSGDKEAKRVEARCEDLVAICEITGKWGDLPGKFEPGAGTKNSEGGKSTGGGGSKPKPGAHRTADGGIIMVTPEGREWVWNGKYNLVARYERNGVIGEYHSVMQGDPDANWRKVNGKNIQESDPRYMAEADAAAAKLKAEQDAKNAAAQKAASKQTKETIAAAKDPNGILKRGGTKITKEDVDDPRGASGQNGANSNASNAAANAHSSVANPVSATAGSAIIKFKPPASAPVTASPVAAPPVTAPPAAVSGIDRRPGRNAQ